VQLPGKLLPEVRLPVELQRAVILDGREVEVQVNPSGLVLTPAHLWYAAEVKLGGAPATVEDSAPGEGSVVPGRGSQEP
jgi:hypothetical protein